MADVLTAKQRRFCMSRIKSKDTKPEIMVRKFLFSHGFRYRVNRKDLPGRPDIVLPKYKTVIFINGCFWHGHPGCKYATMPETNKEFWTKKINSNMERDISNVNELIKSGWRVITIWQCQLKSKNKDKTLSTLLSELKNERKTKCIYTDGCGI